MVLSGNISARLKLLEHVISCLMMRCLLGLFSFLGDLAL